VERIERLGKAVEDTMRGGNLLLGFVEGLTDAKSIAAAEATEREAAAAVAG
jgi:hypothetical protein